MPLVRWLGGPCVALAFFCADDHFADPAHARMAGVLLWTVGWWVFETLPLAVTALVPCVLLPSAGVLSASRASSAYMNDIVMMLIGTQLVGEAIQTHRIDRRIALVALTRSAATGSVYRLVRGTLAAVWGMSWWMSNTGTAACFMPLAMQLAREIDAAQNQQDAEGAKSARGTTTLRATLPLALAYVATAGGMATLTGTGPNVLIAEIYSEMYPQARRSVLQMFESSVRLGGSVVALAECRMARQATPPNAIAFSGGELVVMDMARPGLLANLTGIVLTTLFTYTLGSLVFGLSELPEWSKGAADGGGCQ